MKEKIVIDEKFKGLLPALDKATFELLEANLLENGCRDSLVLWGDILIDGHNRYNICLKHDIPFNTVTMDFDSREEATIWIITTQVARRNLNTTQLSRYRGIHYLTEKKRPGSSNQYINKSATGHNDQMQNAQETAPSLGDYYNVSSRTIRRDGKIAEAIERIGEVSTEAERVIVSENVKIDKKVLEALAAASNKKVEEFAYAVENGTYDKRKPGSDPSSEQDQDSHTVPVIPSFPGASGVGAPDAQIDSSAAPLSDMIIRYIANGVLTELREYSSDSTPVLKASLRSCIDMLEGMYWKL